MNFNATWVVGVALCAWPTFARADDGFDISGTVRLRYEAISNQPRVGYGRSSDLFNIRTTILAKYENGPLTIAGELWDSRAYGADRGSPVTTGEVNTIEPVQAYVVYAAARGSTKIGVQAGRFTLNLGSRRLVGADDYRNTVTGFTGLRADATTKDGLTATAIYVLPQQRRPDGLASLRNNAVKWDHEGSDLVLWGGTLARAHALGPMTAEATFYHLGEHDLQGRPTRDRSIDTYGGRMINNPASGTIDGEVEAFYQSGSISASTASTSARVSVSAWFVHADFGYTNAGAWKPHLSIEYDRASGDRAGGAYGRFDTLFGMRRADLAPAGIYNAIGRANISTPGARVEITPSPRWDAFASYHALWLAQKTDSFSTTGVRDASGQSGTFAGHQLDGRVRWWIRPSHLRFELDGLLLMRGRFLDGAPNTNAHGTAAYGSVNLTASF